MNRDVDLEQFDGAGQMIFHDATTQPDDTYSYDGNGALTKWVQTGTGAPFYYYLRSSVLGANVLELTSTGAMYKEYVFSRNGSQMAYLQSGTVTWIHEEPSGKERYEIKQDRTANSKITYDPTGATATSDGYSGGAPCPPQSCYSPANTPVMAMINRGFDGLNRLTQQRNAEWLQSHQFEILTTPVGWFQKTKDGNWYFPGSDKPHVAGSLTPIYDMSISFLDSSLQQTQQPHGPVPPANPTPTECQQGTDALERQTALENYNIMAPNHPLSHLRAAREGWIGETSDPQ